MATFLRFGWPESPESAKNALEKPVEKIYSNLMIGYITARCKGRGAGRMVSPSLLAPRILFHDRAGWRSKTASALRLRASWPYLSIILGLPVIAWAGETASFPASGCSSPQISAEVPREPIGERLGERRLQLDPSLPFYPRSGLHPLLLLGVSDRAALILWSSDKGFDWRRYLDDLTANGFNYVRQDLTAWTGLSLIGRYRAQFTHPRWAFMRTGPGTAGDGGLRFDLARLDDGYFEERLVPFLEVTERRGIIVELTLFEDCHRRRVFEDSLYAESNNVNNLGLKSGDDPHSDRTLDNRRLLSLQENYVAGILRVTARFGNILYEVANETGGKRWVAHWIEFIHQQLPGSLVSAGEMGSPYDPIRGGCDLIVKHRGTGGPYRTPQDVTRHRRSLIQLREGRKPVLHNEFFLSVHGSTEDPNFVRWMMWGDFTGGGHVNFYDFSSWRGTGRELGEGEPSRPPPTIVLAAGRFLRRFVEEGKIPFWSMEPHDELAVRPEDPGFPPFIMARPGEIYVVYLIRGGVVSLDLKAMAGSLYARWYDPRGGSFKEEFTVVGGEVRAFTAPGPDDWALLLTSRPSHPALIPHGTTQ